MNKRLRADFPILSRKINGYPLVYLDSAATSQKPNQVLAAISDYYKKHNANVHRGIHTLSVEATEAYEGARKKVAEFVGVKDTSEIIFVRNATEAINLVAYSWGRLNISKGDEIVVTVAEHHSNFVPWQQLAAEKGAALKIIPVLENGELDLLAFRRAITSKTKLVTFFHVSNVLGTINDVRYLTSIIHNLSPQAKILVDGAQAVPHMKVDITKLGCDFYVFTGHKMLGPTGIGVLWGKRKLLDSMPPFMFGGEMISKVSVEKSTWSQLPWKFEAGTPNIAGVIGLGAAVDYLTKVGMDNVRKHEIELVDYAILELSKIPEVQIYGPLPNRHSEPLICHSGLDPESRSRNSSASLRASKFGMTRKGPFANARDDSTRAGVVSFNVGKIHAHDVASILDSVGVAIRSGHHCAQPLMDFLKVPSVARASFYLYNTKEDVDRLVVGLRKVRQVFRLAGTRVTGKNKKISARQPDNLMSG